MSRRRFARWPPDPPVCPQRLLERSAARSHLPLFQLPRPPRIPDSLPRSCASYPTGRPLGIAVHFTHAKSESATATRKGEPSVRRRHTPAVAVTRSRSPSFSAVESDPKRRNHAQPSRPTMATPSIIVPTAQEALEILRTTVPSVFIAEVEAGRHEWPRPLPHRQAQRTPQHVPVILLTASAQPADYTASHQLGAMVCMAKPFKPERLLHVVRLVAPPPLCGRPPTPAASTERRLVFAINSCHSKAHPNFGCRVRRAAPRSRAATFAPASGVRLVPVDSLVPMLRQPLLLQQILPMKHRMRPHIRISRAAHRSSPLAPHPTKTTACRSPAPPHDCPRTHPA